MTTADDSLMSIHEVAGLALISAAEVRRLVAADAIPHTRPDRRHIPRFPRRAILAWLHERRSDAQPGAQHPRG